MIADLPPTTEVTMPARRFAPAHVSVLTGEAVTWRNTDHTTHVVSDTAHGIDSGRIPPGGQFTHRFRQTGTYRYLCTIHRSMRGTVDVASIALQGPRAPVAAGSTVTLTGRAPAGTSEDLRLERDGRPVEVVRPKADGTFSVPVAADAPARYRVVGTSLYSAPADVAVAPDLRVRAGRSGRRITVRVESLTPQPGARVELQRYVRERFDFLPLRSVRLNSASRARFVLRTSRRTRLRVGLTRPVGGFARSVSEPLFVDGRGSSKRRHGAMLDH